MSDFQRAQQKAGFPSWKNLYRAAATPKFPPKVATALLEIASQRYGLPSKMYDPFCGNGVILLAAYLKFKREFPTIGGSDANEDAVIASKLNLICAGIDEQLADSAITIKNAALDKLGVKDAVVITDPLFGRRCDFYEGSSLEESLENLRACGARGVVFCFDEKTPVSEKTRRAYSIKEFGRKWDRVFHSASF
jgi:tRNA G10  N-methylase Trm11